MKDYSLYSSNSTVEIIQAYISAALISLGPYQIQTGQLSQYSV